MSSTSIAEDLDLGIDIATSSHVYLSYGVTGDEASVVIEGERLHVIYPEFYIEGGYEENVIVGMRTNLTTTMAMYAGKSEPIIRYAFCKFSVII